MAKYVKFLKNQQTNFLKEIKPANYKHLLKYKVYKEKGFVPLTEDIMRE